MEKITDKIAALPEDGSYFSLEFFPPKTQTVSMPQMPCMFVLMTSKGLYKPSSASGTHVSSLEASFRQRNLGRRRKHRVEIPRTGRDHTTPIEIDDMSSPHLYEHESVVN